MTTNEMPPPPEPLAVRVAELDRRVRENDVGWFREQHAAGSLGWLEPHLGPTEYRALGSAIEAGDMGLVGRRLAAMDEATTVLHEPVAAVTTMGPAIVASTVGANVIGDPLSSAIDDPTLMVSRRGSVLPVAAVRRERNTLIVTAIILTLIAAGVVAYLLLRNNGDTVADTSIASETIAPDTVVGVAAVTTAPLESGAPTTASAIPTTAASATAPPPTAPPTAATTVAAAVQPPKVAAPVPVVTVPLQDVVRTASRSATFGPYLSMVQAAGLTNELRALKNVTIFAPTESAFAALPTDVQAALRSPSNRDVLARIVRYSVVTQSRSAAQLTPGNYTTVEGSTVNVQLLNGTIRVNDATITGPDVKVVNGVLHAVDRLLVPATFDLNSLVPRSAAPARVTTVASTSPPTAAPTAAPLATSAPAVTPNTVPVTSPATTAAPSPTVAPTTVAPTTRAPTTVAPTTRAPTTTVA